MSKVTPDSIRSNIIEWLEPGELLLQYTVGGLDGHSTDAIIALTNRYVRIGSPTGGTNIPLASVKEIKWSGLWARLNLSTVAPQRKLVVSLTGSEWKQRAAQLAEEWSSIATKASRLLPHTQPPNKSMGPIRPARVSDHVRYWPRAGRPAPLILPSSALGRSRTMIVAINHPPSTPRRAAMKRVLKVLPLTIPFLVVSACGVNPSPSEAPYVVDIVPGDFVQGVRNSYFPLTPGSTYVYENHTDEGVERIVVEVLHETREVMGITATVVRDTVTLDGELIEDTYDWYAQDIEGNVWYLGEDVSNYEDGEFHDKAGSWEAGVDEALPGIIMYADPAAHIGETYRQEYYPGHAEDMADLLGVAASITVPAGSFANVLETRDYTPLEPGMIEQKYYAPGVGLVKTANLETGEEDQLLEYSIP